MRKYVYTNEEMAMYKVKALMKNHYTIEEIAKDRHMSTDKVKEIINLIYLERELMGNL